MMELSVWAAVCCIAHLRITSRSRGIMRVRFPELCGRSGHPHQSHLRGHMSQNITIAIPTAGIVAAIAYLLLWR